MVLLLARCYDNKEHLIFEATYTRKETEAYDFTFAIRAMRLNPAVSRVVFEISWPVEQ